MNPRTRSRLILVALAAMFGAPLIGAIALHASGWQPTHTRNHGELLRPAVSLEGIALQRADGSPYEWEPVERRWRIAVVAPRDCQAACAELITGLDKVWQLQGRHADRLDVLWFGALPDGATPFRRLVPMRGNADFNARLPGFDPAAPPSAWLIDPAGFVALRYAPGFDVAHVREDVARMLKQ